MPSPTQAKLKRIYKKLERIGRRTDDAIARKLLRRLEAVLAVFDTDPEWAGQLRSLDHRAFARRHGIEALRTLLDDFNSNELKNFVKERGIVSAGLSKLTKGDVVNRIIFAAKAA